MGAAEGCSLGPSSASLITRPAHVSLSSPCLPAQGGAVLRGGRGHQQQLRGGGRGQHREGRHQVHGHRLWRPRGGPGGLLVDGVPGFRNALLSLLEQAAKSHPSLPSQHMRRRRTSCQSSCWAPAASAIWTWTGVHGHAPKPQALCCDTSAAHGCGCCPGAAAFQILAHAVLPSMWLTRSVLFAQERPSLASCPTAAAAWGFAQVVLNAVLIMWGFRIAVACTSITTASCTRTTRRCGRVSVPLTAFDVAGGPCYLDTHS